MNILIAADYATPNSGNFIASCVELGRRLKTTGDGLTFIFPESQNTLNENSWVSWLKREGFCVYLAKGDMPQAQVVPFLKDIICKHKIDILHIHFGMFHHTAVYNGKELNVKLLVHDHMDFVDTESRVKQKAKCIVRSAVYRKNSVAVVSVNPQKDNSYLFAKHQYIPNGLSLERNIEYSAKREEIKTRLGIAPNEKICLFLGWDLHRKGFDVAIKAVNELRKKDSDVVWGIVGVGEHPDKECERFISETTGTDPNSSWIKYLPSTEDMFAYHRAADVYLSASRAEAFSYGILEAISQNTPIAVSDIKGTSWCHGYTRLCIYPTEDYKACADAVSNAMNLRSAESNAEEIVNKYSIEKWCDKIIDVYKKL